MKRFEIFFGLIKIPIDLIMTISAFFVAYNLRLITEPIRGIAKPIDYTVLPTLSAYLEFSSFLAAALILIFIFGKLYTLRTTLKFTTETKQVFIFWFIWAAFCVTYFFFTRTFPFSRLATLYSWSLTLLFIIIGRGIIKIIQLILLENGIGKRNLLFIGQNEITDDIYKNLKKDSRYKIIGIIEKPSQLEYTIKHKNIDEIIQTDSTINAKDNEEILQLCDLNHISYKFVPELIDVRRSNISISTIGRVPIISLKPTPLEGWGRVIKRCIDFFGSLMLLILLSPILIITAIAIKLDSKGPIFFIKKDDGQRVKRVGQFGELFNFYKFRSMHPKTDSMRYKELSSSNTRKNTPLVKIKNDPRVTKVGKFIRRYSIDELPQLFSVFVGDMSLVGPRPHLPEEVAKYEKSHKFVLTIKPGITGISQISGRSDLPFEEEIKLDRYYIENWSIIFDLKILLKTIFVVLKGHTE